MKKVFSTAIEISDTHVKMLQARALRNKTHIVSCEVRSLVQQSDEELTNILTDLTRSKTVQPERLTVTIPRRLVILKFMKLPSQNIEEVKKMAGLQLVNQIPYSLDDVIYDCQVARKDSAGYMHVLVVVVHKNVCDRYLSIFKKIGIPLEKLSLSSFGILGWLSYQKKQGRIDASSPTVVVNIDQEHSEINFCFEDKLLFSRHIEQGAKNLNGDDIFDIVQQVRVSLDTYHKDAMGPDIKRIVILSGMSEANLLKEKLEQDLRIHTEVFNFLDNIYSHKKINLNTLKDQVGVSLAVGIGTLLSPAMETVNLMPSRVHEDKRSKLVRRQLLQFISLIVVTSLLACAYFGIELYQKSQVLSAVQQRVKETKNKIKDAKRVISFTDFFDEEFSERVYVSELVGEIYRLAPPEISVKSLSYNKNGSFTIQGYGQDRTSVNRLNTSMSNSKMFETVKLQFSTKRKIFNMDVSEFKINAQIAKLSKKEN